MDRTTISSQLPTYQDRSHDARSLLTPSSLAPAHGLYLSAICTQTHIILWAQALETGLQCSCTTLLSTTQMRHSMHLCISVHSQKIHYEELQDCRSEMDSWSSSHARARHFSCHQEEWLSAECHSYNVPLHPSGALISAQPLLRAVAEVKW